MGLVSPLRLSIDEVKCVFIRRKKGGLICSIFLFYLSVNNVLGKMADRTRQLHNPGFFIGFKVVYFVSPLIIPSLEAFHLSILGGYVLV